MKIELKLFIWFVVLFVLTAVFLPEADNTPSREDVSNAGVLLPTIDAQL